MTAGRRWTLRTRLLVPLLGLLLLGLAGAPAVASLVMTRDFDARAEDRLRATSQAVGGLLSGRDRKVVGSDRADDLPTAGGLLLIGLDADDRVTFVVDRRGPTADRAAAEPLVVASREAAPSAVRTVDVGGTTYTVLRTSTPGLVVATDTRQVDVPALVLALDRSDDEAAVRVVRRTGVAFAVVAMLVLGGLAVLTLVRGLRPLTRMAAVAAEGGDFRDPARADPPELARLGEALAAASQARDRAEQTVRSFMLDASHELRTPLTGLSGWLDLYAQGGLDDHDELDRAMGRMESEVGRMRLLVDELDLLARMDQGRPLELTELDVGPVLAGVVEDVRVVDPEREVGLRVSGDPRVRADRPRLEQVVRNLLGNALQHTPAGTPVEVLADTDDRWVTVAVVDHGPGFAPADVDRVFERFYRAESARSEPGSGLGLAIVRALVEAHHGTVVASATSGGGATVTLRLPVVVSEPSGRA